MNLKSTHAQFWIGIPILILVSLILPKTIDLYVYIDHYVIEPMKIAIYLSVFLLLSGFGYYVNRKKEMNDNWTLIHKKYTLRGVGLSFLVFIILLIKNWGLTEPPFGPDFKGFSLDQFLALLFIVGSFIVFLGFLVYFLNTAITTFFTEQPTDSTNP